MFAISTDVPGDHAEPDRHGGFAIVSGLLRDADQLVQGGKIQQAREACVALVFRHLPWFVADRGLLIRLVAALLATGSHVLLCRVLRATTGCCVRLLSAQANSPAGPLASCCEQQGESVLERSGRIVDWAYRTPSGLLART